MSGELETTALASGGGWLKWKRQQADIPPGTPCANCETPLEGTYCHVCGQLAEDFHKSIWKLTVEAVESLLHPDDGDRHPAGAAVALSGLQRNGGGTDPVVSRRASR